MNNTKLNKIGNNTCTKPFAFKELEPSLVRKRVTGGIFSKAGTNRLLKGSR